MSYPSKGRYLVRLASQLNENDPAHRPAAMPESRPDRHCALTHVPRHRVDKHWVEQALTTPDPAKVSYVDADSTLSVLEP